MKFSTAETSEHVHDYLKRRRSCSLKLMGHKAPTDKEIIEMLKIASRVPDHGKINPWYFIVFKSDARRDVGEILRDAYQLEDKDASDAKLDLESERFLRAPLVILVVSRLRYSNKPIWEQFLSSGAACYNLCLAANSMGYGTNWLTEWYSYNQTFKESIGLDKRDHIAGAIYIGDLTEPPKERDRPDLEKVMTFWKSGIKINKGDQYDSGKKLIPPKRFTLPDEFI